MTRQPSGNLAVIPARTTTEELRWAGWAAATARRPTIASTPIETTLT